MFYFFSAIATFLIINFINKRNTSYLYTKDYLLLGIGICAYLLPIYLVYAYYKNSPRVAVDANTISFNKEQYAWEQVSNIELVGKQKIPFFGGSPIEAATIYFKNGVKKIIVDDMYSNTWEIKCFIKQVVIDKKAFTEMNTPPIDKHAVVSDFYDNFKGNQLTSFTGILLWGFIGIFAYMLINKITPVHINDSLFISAISMFWFLILSYQMHYFKVSNNYFIIRNHNFFWMHKLYDISDIIEVVLETPGKMPNCVRIITKDFKSNLYPAATLTNKTWLGLKDKLESLNIKVRNECI